MIINSTIQYFLVSLIPSELKLWDLTRVIHDEPSCIHILHHKLKSELMSAI